MSLTYATGDADFHLSVESDSVSFICSRLQTKANEINEGHMEKERVIRSQHAQILGSGTYNH